MIHHKSNRREKTTTHFAFHEMKYGIYKMKYTVRTTMRCTRHQNVHEMKLVICYFLSDLICGVLFCVIYGA